jgi:hypothetical protein
MTLIIYNEFHHLQRSFQQISQVDYQTCSRTITLVENEKVNSIIFKFVTILYRYLASIDYGISTDQS